MRFALQRRSILKLKNETKQNAQQIHNDMLMVKANVRTKEHICWCCDSLTVAAKHRNYFFFVWHFRFANPLRMTNFAIWMWFFIESPTFLREIDTFFGWVGVVAFSVLRSFAFIFMSPDVCGWMIRFFYPNWNCCSFVRRTGMECRRNVYWQRRAAHKPIRIIFISWHFCGHKERRFRVRQNRNFVDNRRFRPIMNESSLQPIHACLNRIKLVFADLRRFLCVCSVLMVWPAEILKTEFTKEAIRNRQLVVSFVRFSNF